VERDDGLRAACFLALDALRAQLGEELPYRGGLDQGFLFGRRGRVPFLSHMKGIYRAAAQRGPAALSVHTSPQSPYAKWRPKRDSCTTTVLALKGFHGRPIELPSRRTARPDRERLAIRFDAFLERG
jgi:hypothetical protein